MDITEKLLSILHLINDWLKFAEAKNALLLAFCGAAITAIVTYLSAAPNISSEPLRIGLLFSLFLLCICSVICSLSLLPKTDREYLIWWKKKPSKKFKNLQQETDNLYFYDEIRKYSSTDLLDSMNKLYFDNKLQPPYKKEDLDIADQIVINSQIASAKFAFFRVALWFLIGSIFVVFISGIFSFLMSLF